MKVTEMLSPEICFSEIKKKIILKQIKHRKELVLLLHFPIDEELKQLAKSIKVLSLVSHTKHGIYLIVRKT